MAYYLMALAPVGYWVTNRIVKTTSDKLFRLEPLREEELDVEGLVETTNGLLKMYSSMPENHPAYVSKTLLERSMESLETNITFAKYKNRKYWGWADFSKENKKIHLDVKKLEKRLSRFIEIIQITSSASDFNHQTVRIVRE